MSRSPTEAQRKQQLLLLHAVHEHDVCHLIDSIGSLDYNRWISLVLPGNKYRVDIRIEADGRVTSFHGVEGMTDPVEKLTGQWLASERISAAVRWMETGKQQEGT